MKTILLPSDFKKHSDKALDFSIELARLSGSKIIVSNSYLFPVVEVNVPMNIIEEIYEEERGASLALLRGYYEKIKKIKLKNGDTIPVEYRTEQNFPVDEIREISTQKNVDLIIMGTENKEHRYQFWNSTTMEVLKNTDKPILIVQEESNWKPFKRITFAIDTKESMDRIKHIIPIAKLFNSEISILHITKFPEDIQELEEVSRDKQEYEKWIEEIKVNYNYSKINLAYQFADDTFEKMDNLLKLKSSDLLVISKSNKSWLTNLFKESFTEHILKVSSEPLMIV